MEIGSDDAFGIDIVRFVDESRICVPTAFRKKKKGK